MWGLQLLVVVGTPDWQAAEVQTYWLSSASITVGRPAKGQAATAVDIVVQGDTAVSKVHCTLRQQGGQLSIQDQSRYGTAVNGDKMQAESVRQLQEGDAVKLAAKVHIRVLHRPLVLCCCPGVTLSPEASELVSTSGDQVVHEWRDGITHVLAATGQQASSLLLRALLEGTQLELLCTRKVWAEALVPEQSYQPETLALPSGACEGGDGDAQPWQQRPLAQCIGPRDAGCALLSDFSFFYVNGFQDDGLAYCVRVLGAQMPQGKPRSVGEHQNVVCVSEAVQFVHEEESAGELLAHVPASELLACLLSADISPVRQRVINASLLAKARAKEREREAALPGPGPGYTNGALGTNQRPGQTPGQLQAQAKREEAEEVEDITEEEEDPEVPLPSCRPQSGVTTVPLDGAYTMGTTGRGRERASGSSGGDNVGPAVVASGRGPLASTVQRQQGQRKDLGDEAGALGAAVAAGDGEGDAAGRPVAMPNPGRAAKASGAGFKTKGASRAAVKVGPGHAVMFLPLVTQPGQQGQRQVAQPRAESRVSNDGVPNFKAFRKAGLAATSTQQLQPSCSQVSSPVPLMVVEVAPPPELVATDTDPRLESRKRKAAEDLFEASVKAKRK